MMPLVELAVQTFWLLLPAGIANMVPPLAMKIDFLAYPVDFGLTFREKPLLGKNKSFRGLFFGILAAIMVALLQKIYHPAFSLVDYGSISAAAFGAALGCGALLGDMAKSFFKRQLDVAPGKPWIPFDQIDWIIGALIAASLFVPLSLSVIITSFVLFSVLHVAINLAGYALRLKKNKL